MSKIVKKITKPISRGLDKIVPNELKPALPYLAAFAPYLLPGGGMFASMIGRGLGSAGFNAIGQLAQEGNEGELNALSLLLAGGQGALSAPGDASRGIKSASQRLRGFKNPGEASFTKLSGGNMPGQGMGGFTTQYDKSNLGFFDNAKNFGAEGLANLADKIGGARDTLGGALKLDPTQANLEKIGMAATAPISQGTGDVLYGEAIKQKKDFDRSEAIRKVEEEMRARGLTQEYIDSITASMSAYGYTQAEIDEILELQGYELANGGRVGYAMGGDIMQGIMAMVRSGGMDASQPDFNSMDETVENVNMKKQDDMMFEEEYITIMGEDGPIRIKKSDYEAMPGMFMDTTTSAYGDAGRGRPVPEFANGGSAFPQDMEIENLMAAYEPGVPTTGDLYDMNNPDYKGINKKIIIEFMEEGIPLGYTSPEEYFDDFYGPFAKKEKNTMTAKNGGIMNNYNMGGSVLPQGMEMDYRQGGMIPMGSAERADDVPARVSKNEFVMTADAVRAAGGGSVNQGAKKMYKLMNNLEARA